MVNHFGKKATKGGYLLHYEDKKTHHNNIKGLYSGKPSDSDAEKSLFGYYYR
jgi:hypothetical protein